MLGRRTENRRLSVSISRMVDNETTSDDACPMAVSDTVGLAARRWSTAGVNKRTVTGLDRYVSMS